MSSAALLAGQAAASDIVRVGAIGTGGRGRFLVSSFLQHGGVTFPVVCDVDRLNSAKANQEALGGRAEVVSDYRRILDRRDIDAVLIATPDHWHALATIHACQAGKDVYVEKPMCYAIAEGRRMVDAARRYQRVVQVGSQQLSGAHYLEAARLVQSGKLGKVTLVRAWNTGNRWPGLGFPPDEAAPETLDWDRWLGPAPTIPYNPVKASAKFRFFWDFSGGILTDWGAHHVTSVHQIMGQDRPLSAVAAGGKFAIRDLLETPDTLTVVWEYPGWTLEYTHREANGYSPDGSNYGVVFHGTQASLFIDRVGYELIPEANRNRTTKAGHPRVDIFNSEELEYAHIRDFLECIRSRRRPRGDVEIAQRATTVPLLGNIALRTGRKILWDAEKETIAGDAAAAEYLSRRAYRAPYVLPEI